jgi:predicted PurR-regulated permease PerM
MSNPFPTEVTDPFEVTETHTHKPRVLVILLMLVSAAAAFSYLSAYALTDALIAAEVIHRWPVGRDPRPRWMAIAFVTLLSAALLVAVAFRVMSHRQMREIDRMQDEG